MSLDDIEAIRQLKARYFRLLDTKNWAAWRDLFTDDAQFEGTSRPFSGPDQFCAATSEWLGPAVTVHQGFMPEIRIEGADHASGIWAMEDLVQFDTPIDRGAYAGMIGFHGYGHYEESYRREKGEWRICFLRLTRLRLDPLPPGSALSPLPAGLLRSGEDAG
jgi:hypothetical protein